MKLSSIVWPRIFKFLIFSYEILWLVEDEVFTPMERGKREIVILCLHDIVGNPELPNLELTHYGIMSPEQ